MNRFQRRKSSVGVLKKAGTVAVVAVVFVCFWTGIGSVSKETRQQQKKSLENAIWKDVVQCYAMEGCYPESLTYMEEHYGLTYDKKRFFVDYEILGSNMMPDITVIEQGESNEE